MGEIYKETLQRRYMKTCPTSLVISDKQIKTALREYYTPKLKNGVGPSCPWTGEWINEFCYIHNNGMLLINKKEQTADICYNMDASQNN